MLWVDWHVIKIRVTRYFWVLDSCTIKFWFLWHALCNFSALNKISFYITILSPTKEKKWKLLETNHTRAGIRIIRALKVGQYFMKPTQVFQSSFCYKMRNNYFLNMHCQQLPSKSIKLFRVHRYICE